MKYRYIISIFLTGIFLLGISTSGFATHQGIVSPSAIRQGALGIKYFLRAELERTNFDDVDLSNVRYLAELDLNLLASGGPPRDGIPSVDLPRLISPEEAATWLEDNDLVIGLRFNGAVRAYPVNILNWHEITNDILNGIPVVVTYCPLCNSALAFVAPEINGQIAQFGISGRLFKSDLVMYDRVTGTFWSQIEALPIVGPLVGRVGKLHQVPVDIIPWGLWQAENPETMVMDRPVFGDVLGGVQTRPISGILFPRDYGRDPYAAYKRSNSNTFGTPFSDTRLRAKDDVIGIIIDGDTKAYARKAYDELSLLNDRIGNTPILVVKTPADQVRFFVRRDVERDRALEFEFIDGRLIDKQTRSVWNFRGEAVSGEFAGTQLEEISAIPSFWFAWVSFNPDTELFTG
ncbi:MAG: DUF3179 domain-containing protein [Candidatus Bipolaricaulia bacterium]